eukprot:CAMPEP_0119209340 /NCGR_PEP_ID=MMETSP1327-20130426/1386_1 /TAXON_ID=38833 /ORGANISM="Micromonas pusilla, Strain RCC2306" /LENGTH=64 /DNA_ID=CAMNT_0007206145 /DNA_START=32 /DNA_END=226 /DNA_ORIENTATION=-
MVTWDWEGKGSVLSLEYGCVVWANSAYVMYVELPVLVNVRSGALEEGHQTVCLAGFGKRATRTM